MTKKFDAFITSILSEMAVNATPRELSDVEAAEAFTKGGNYGKYVMSADEVKAALEKIRERVPSDLDWKEFREDILERIVRDVVPRWANNATNCTRAARVLYDKLRGFGILQDERDGYTYGDGENTGVDLSDEDVEISDEDAEEIASDVNAEVKSGEGEASVETPEEEEDVVENLTPTQEAIYNFVANSETPVSRKELNGWIRTEFGFDEDEEYNEAKHADARADLTALLASKILFKDGDNIVAELPTPETEEGEGGDIEALEPEMDAEDAKKMEADYINKYLGHDRPERYGTLGED